MFKSTAFEGLTFSQWVKLLLRTRAQTLHQCDNVIGMLTRANLEATKQSEAAKESSTLYASLLIIQQEALHVALKELPQDSKAYSLVRSAIRSAENSLPKPSAIHKVICRPDEVYGESPAAAVFKTPHQVEG